MLSRANPHMPLPAALGPWILGDEIGQGGFGRVLRARHRITRKVAAVKVLNPQRTSEEQRQRFLQEIELLSEIDNMNVVGFYDADITPDGLIWMAMELLSGATLAEHMARVGVFSVEDAIRIASDIADGLGAAHMIGVVHRDLKPQNVFVTSDDVIKVLDFGISKLKNPTIVRNKAPKTDATRILGTFTYLSPEQLQNREVDYRTDVFALGVVLYELLTGQNPFMVPEEPSPEPLVLGLRIMSMTATPVHEIVPSIPGDVWYALKKALEKDPNRRYPSLVEFKRAIWDVRAELLVREKRSGAPLASLRRRDASMRPLASSFAPPTATATSTGLRELRKTMKMETTTVVALAKTDEEAIPAALADEIARGIAPSPEREPPWSTTSSSPAPSRASLPQQAAAAPVTASTQEVPRLDFHRALDQPPRIAERPKLVELKRSPAPPAPTHEAPSPSTATTPPRPVEPRPPSAPRRPAPSPQRTSLVPREVLASVGVALAILLVFVPILQRLHVLDLPWFRTASQQSPADSAGITVDSAPSPSAAPQPATSAVPVVEPPRSATVVASSTPIDPAKSASTPPSKPAPNERRTKLPRAPSGFFEPSPPTPTPQPTVAPSSTTIPRNSDRIFD